MLREIHSPSLTHSRHPRSILISLRSSRRLSSNQFSARTQRSSYQSSYRRTFRPNSPSLFTSSSSLLSLLSPWASLRMRRCRRQFSSTPSVQATYNQVRRGCRKEQRARRRRSPDLVNRPQMKGVCLKTGITKPKKPNSGERKTARIRLSSGKVITAYIPGEGKILLSFSLSPPFFSPPLLSLHLLLKKRWG